MKKRLIQLTVLGFILWIMGSVLGSKIATMAHPKEIPDASNYFSQSVENHTFSSFDKVQISSWFIPADSSSKAVVILNGIGGSRLGLIKRAQYYVEKGYNVLLPDLRGTGASGGKTITFGWKERYDLQASIQFLKEKGIEEIAVHGLSLGAATIVYSFQEKPDYKFVVLESCYDNITNALNNRVDKIPLPDFIYYPLRKFTEMRVEATEEQLSPASYMSLCNFPTFVMAGDSEKKVKLKETLKLYDKCAAITKQLHFFKGAYHENFMNRFSKDWRVEMENWLERFE